MGANALDLSGKIAIVTGAGRGIGAAMAKGLASFGADVTIVDLPDRSGDAAEVVRFIEDAGGRATTLEGDVTDPEAIAGVVSATVEKHGRLDIMVNNAGVIARNLSLDVTPEEWDTVLNVNLRGVFFGCQAAARQMINTGGGKIINTASELAFVVPKERISAAYMASKGGVVNLTRALAVEWARHNIRVNAVAPGPTNTQMMAPALADPKTYDATVSEIPMGRIVEPDDIVGAVAFLASDLSNMVTGHVILVDGGRALV
ncbi:MAG: glucose 1-dehydrogenase [Chloroflexi bacterium]|nr:glucose 1-dehydrogenase [Chloroflexota bacterium]